MVKHNGDVSVCFTVVSLVLSVAALAVSVATLYLTFLRSPRIQIIAGDHLNIHHFPEGNVGVSLPVIIANNGANLGTVRRVALLVQSHGSSEGYLLEPFFYQRVKESGDFVQDSQPVPIIVGAEEPVTKQILFRSSLDRPSEFQFTKPGTYNILLLGWVSRSEKPDVADSFSVVVSEDETLRLTKLRQEKSGTSVRFPQSRWKQWVARHLTESEVKPLKRESR